MNNAILTRSRLRSALATLVVLLVVFAVPLMAAEEETAPDSWAPTFAKIFNFALLAGGVYLFAKKMGFPEYLVNRSKTIRKDLVDAKTLRSEAEQQLAGVRDRLAKLPAELSALKQRGQEELASEKVRLADATAAERARVQEQTRREIELTSRLARRDLMLHSANLSMDLAKKRLERDITADDQARLIDSYKPEVRQ
jgi:F-type H+-transporting ATPase subunit b